MHRRDFIKVIASSVAAWPLTARAQQPAMPVVGSLRARGRNDRYLPADEIGSEGRESIKLPLGKAIFERQILPFNKSHFPKTGLERHDLIAQCRARSGHHEHWRRSAQQQRSLSSFPSASTPLKWGL